jgi:hypothetical protein
LWPPNKDFSQPLNSAWPLNTPAIKGLRNSALSHHRDRKISTAQSLYQVVPSSRWCSSIWRALNSWARPTCSMKTSTRRLLIGLLIQKPGLRPW